MKIKIFPVEKYDKTAEKEAGATIVGIISLLVYLYLKAQPTTLIEPQTFNYFLIGFRVAAVAWMYQITKKQNRNPTGWMCFATVWPSLTLIVCGFVSKKNLSFGIDTSCEDDYQIIALRNYADKLIHEKKDYEAAFVYKYIIAKLPSTETDINTYNELTQKSNRAIPEFYIKEQKESTQKAVVLLLLCICIGFNSYSQIYRFKSFKTKVNCDNDVSASAWNDVDIVIVIDQNKHKVKTFGNRELNIDIISASDEYTTKEGYKAVDWTGVDEQGVKCYITLIGYDNPTKKHIGTLIIGYRNIGCMIYFRLMKDDN